MVALASRSWERLYREGNQHLGPEKAGVLPKLSPKKVVQDKLEEGMQAKQVES